MSSGVDPVVGIAQVLAVFVGSATAALIAPHLVVVIAGGAGGVLGLMSWRAGSAWEGLRYVVGMGGLAWLFTGSAAEVAALYVNIEDKRLVAPMALAIGWIGHRWPAVGAWVGRMARSAIETAMRGSK